MRGVRIVAAGVLVAGMFIAGPAMAGSGGAKKVELQDRCAEDFNVFVGPGTCDVTRVEEPVPFLTFAAKLNPVDFGHPKWRVSAPKFDVKPGATISVTSTGGEAHSFTKVEQPGFGGCVPPVNEPLGLAPDPRCDTLVGGVPFIVSEIVPPGATRAVTAPAAPGTYTYLCLIHPWMKSTVTVKS